MAQCNSRYLKSCRLIAVLSSEVIVIDGNHLLCFIKLRGCTTQSATTFFFLIIHVLHEALLDALLGVGDK